MYKALFYPVQIHQDQNLEMGLRYFWFPLLSLQPKPLLCLTFNIPLCMLYLEYVG